MLNPALIARRRRAGGNPLAAYAVNDVNPDAVAVIGSDTYLGGLSAVSDITITQPGTILTYIDADNVVQTASANTPRVDYRTGSAKLLVERATTNLHPFANSYSGATWAMQGGGNGWVATDNAGVSPSGASDAVSLIEASTLSVSKQMYKTVTLSSAGVASVSLMVKPVNRRWFYITLYDGTTFSDVYFDVQTVAVGTTTNGASGTIVQIGDYYLITATQTMASTTCRYYLRSAIADGGVDSYPGTVGYGWHIWGLQVEEGEPTSLVITSGTSETRAADIVSFSDMSETAYDIRATVDGSDVDLHFHGNTTGTAWPVAANGAVSQLLIFEVGTLSVNKPMTRLQYAKVDFVGIGDSNQILSGFGWDHGFQYALEAAGFDMFATGFISANESYADGAGTGYGYNFLGSQNLIGATSGAPSALDAYLDKGSGSLAPHFYAYLSAGTITGSANTGIVINATQNFDTTKAFRYDVHYGTFDSGSGTFRLAVRLNQSPWTGYGSSEYSTNAGEYGMSIASVSISDGTFASAVPVNCRLTNGSTDDTAPIFFLWERAVRTDIDAGFSYSTLDYQGGQSLRTMAYNMQELSDTSLTYYLSALRADQSDTKMTVFCVNSGLNDRNETGTSVGPAAVVDGDSAEAFVDNLTALHTRIENIWSANGWNLNDLCWIIFPSHPVSDPDDAELISYRSATETWASSKSRVQYVDISTLTDEAEMLAEGWYASAGADRNHLTQAGYEQIASRILAAAD